ncbi:MAG: cytochrome b N-terminal domain-containing protein [Woeseiaceae bacterium]|nr:cytochrome b N-terminal domain-containing protein [Woeseiaceae bacterium]
MPENNTNNQQSGRSLILHLRPMWVPARAIKFTHTFGLGGMALVLILLLMFTGILMMFAYEPSPERAWQSISSFQQDVLFGRLIRGVHYWSANLLIPVALLHLLRVFLTGGFHGRRRSNWLIGLGILFFILLSGFTGYLLPWDQTAYWAITICTEMLGLIPGIGQGLQHAIVGGSEIGSATIINFYALHVAVTPMALIVLMNWHFWKIRMAGGVVLPFGPTDDPRNAYRTVPFKPDLLLKETVVTLVLFALVLVIAIVFAAPLGEPANPGISPNPAKAPWYFLGFQELLIHFDATFAILVIPLLVAAALVSVPFLSYDGEIAGDWFLTPKGRRLAIVAAVTSLIVVPLWVLIDEHVIGPGGWLPGADALISNGLIPFALVLGGVTGFYVLIRKYLVANKNEAVQSLFVLLFVAFAVLTATGVWFRGAGMTLVWPWQM